MKKLSLSILILVFFCGQAQSTSSFLDNHSGIQAVSFNPASIADSFYKYDINILSGNLNLGNTVTSVNVFNILEDVNLRADKFKNINDYITKNNFSESSNYYASFSLLGPSFLYTIDQKTSIGFTTGVRLNGSGFNLNSELYEQLNNNDFLDNVSELNKLRNQKITGSFNAAAWAEIGFTFARVIKHTATDILKAGGSVKFLKGINSYSLQLNDFVGDYNLDTNTAKNSIVDIKGSVTTTNSLTANNFGQSLDIGFVYEKRNRTLPKNSRDSDGIYYAKAPYSYKLSISVTDIGSLNFDKVEASINPVDLRLPDDLFEIEDYLGAYNSVGTIKNKFTLPTTAHLNLDYHVSNYWYINTNLDLFLLSRKKINQLQSVSNLSISPRFESRKISAFLPLSVNRFGLFKAGLGIRTGYFFMGSSSLFNNLSNSSKEGDFYMGVKIPIYNKKKVDEYKQSIKHHRF